MKKLMLTLGMALTIAVCLSSCSKDTTYASFGDEITQDGAIDKTEMLTKFEKMNDGDSIDMKFTTTINEVCQAKGCWMKLDLDDNTTTTVKFKDYGFFVPKNAAGLETIVEGKAYKEVTSVAELKHLAEDAGKTQEEIDAITEPQERFTFMASGVLIEEDAE